MYVNIWIYDHKTHPVGMICGIVLCFLYYFSMIFNYQCVTVEFCVRLKQKHGTIEICTGIRPGDGEEVLPG